MQRPMKEIQLVPIKLKRGENQITGQQRYLQVFVKGRKMSLIGKVLSSNLMYVPPKGVKIISGGNV